MQIRGGRGYETAQSLKDRGEKPVPVEAALRDMRINRIFEGSTEIMHLLIAREAVDQHLEVAGEILEGDGDLSAKAKVGVGAAKFYAKWLPQLVVGEGMKPGSYDEFGSLATHLRFVERNSRKLARTTFYAMGRWQAKLEKKQAFLGRIVDIGAELFAISVRRHLRGDDQARAAGDAARTPTRSPTCSASRPGPAREQLFDELWSNNDDANYAAAQDVLKGRFTWIEEGVADPSGDGPMIAGQPEAPAEVPVAAEVH